MISVFKNTYFFTHEMLENENFKIADSSHCRSSFAVGTVTTACTKEKTPNPDGTEIQKKDGFNCLAFGMG